MRFPWRRTNFVLNKGFEDDSSGWQEPAPRTGKRTIKNPARPPDNFTVEEARAAVDQGTDGT